MPLVIDFEPWTLDNPVSPREALRALAERVAANQSHAVATGHVEFVLDSAFSSLDDIDCLASLNFRATMSRFAFIRPLTFLLGR